MEQVIRVNYVKKGIRGYKDYKKIDSAMKFAKKILAEQGNVYIETIWK